MRTIPQIVEAARARLPREVWDYVAGGAESETTLNRNRQAIDRLALKPRVLRDVSTRSSATTVLGQSFSMPVLLAPVGSIHLCDPQAPGSCVRAAAQAGIGAMIGALAAPDPEPLPSVAPAPLFLQFHSPRDREWVRDFVRIAESSGFRGICLSVDTAVYGRRERDIVNGYGPRFRSGMAGQSGALDVEQAKLTWEYVDWLASITSLPVMLKGIQCAEDAALAVEHGAQVVYVSNHGGRQLDHARATIDALPEVVAAVDGRVEVLVDSGFMRGTDVVKAVALGASAVGIGKLMAYALAAGGEAMLVHTLGLLQEEIDVAMALMGAASIADLHPGCVTRC